MKVLAGDIGGTKTWLRIVDASDGAVLFERRYASANYAGLAPMVQDFFAAAGVAARPLGSACFGIAGPVMQHGREQWVNVTNLPWELRSAKLAEELGIPKVAFINDFQAIGYGIEALRAQDLLPLQDAQAVPRAPRLVIGPGTGLGMGIMVWQGDRYEPLPSEGGHVDFAPTDTLQVELLNYLMARCDHVSYERVLSGPGLVTIYEFLREKNPSLASFEENPPSALLFQGEDIDTAAAISQEALAGGDATATQAVRLFVAICGAYAGNLALVGLPFGGVYISGGIAPKLREVFTRGDFMRAFLAKGRMDALLRRMPVHIILNPQVGLLGAALAASRL
ncbi:MAG: glucokinase [Pseudomonadota bacterium]